MPYKCLLLTWVRIKYDLIFSRQIGQNNIYFFSKLAKNFSLNIWKMVAVWIPFFYPSSSSSNYTGIIIIIITAWVSTDGSRVSNIFYREIIGVVCIYYFIAWSFITYTSPKSRLILFKRQLSLVWLALTNKGD